MAEDSGMDATATSSPTTLHRSATLLAGVLALLVSLAVVLLPTAGPAAAADPAEDGLVALLNGERTARGLPALQVVADLQQVAKAQSDRMAASSSLFHNPNLTSDVQHWQRVAENVGYGGSAEVIHGALMASPGHTANILDGAVSQLGIGVTWNGSRLYITQVFRSPTAGAPAPAPPPPPPAPVVPESAPANCPTPLPTAGFVDIATTVHAPAIDCAVLTQLAQGVSPSHFAPANQVSRAQMATFVHRLLTRTGATPSAEQDLFADDAGSTHETAINALAGMGVIAGTADGQFAPNSSITRAQAASLIVRMHEAVAGPMTEQGTPFTDVAGSPHAGAIAKVFAAGITSGTTASTFGPNTEVKRDQMAVFVVRALGQLDAAGALR